MMKNAFYLILKTLFVLQIFKFLSRLFKFNFEIDELLTLLNYNTHIAQYVTK